MNLVLTIETLQDDNYLHNDRESDIDDINFTWYLNILQDNRKLYMMIREN